jgi:hypothetical protein
LAPPKNVPQCLTVLDVAACAARDCAAAGITWKASSRAVALRPAAAQLPIRRALLCVLGMRFTGFPPIVSGTAPRLRQLITLAVVSAESAAFTPC